MCCWTQQGEPLSKKKGKKKKSIWSPEGMNEDEDVWCFAYVELFYSVLRDLMTGCSTDSQHLYIPLSDRPSMC